MTTSKLVLLVGVVMIILAAFGVQPDALGNDFDLGLMGIAVCFAAGLV
jgi:hypothetical protein